MGGKLFIGTSTDAFATSTMPALTFLNNGKVGIGTTSPSYKLDVAGNARLGSGTEAMRISTAGYLGIGTTTPAYLLDVYRGSDGNVAAFTDSNGVCTINPTATALSCSSDERLKRDILSLTSKDSLEKILALNPVSFKWTNQKDDVDRFGLIAQEVELVFPTLVSTSSNGYKAVSYSNFIPFIIDSIKELNKKIEALSDGTLASVSGAYNAVKEIVVERLTIGSKEKPTGITLFDEVTGEPYCLKVRNGTTVTELGECPLVSSSGESSLGIEILGDNPANINVGETFIDPGATAKDQNGNEFTIKTYLDGVEMSPISIDTSKDGSYTIKYEAVDGDGNTASAERVVVVSGGVEQNTATTTPDLQITSDTSTTTSQ